MEERVVQEIIKLCEGEYKEALSSNLPGSYAQGVMAIRIRDKVIDIAKKNGLKVTCDKQL